MRFSRAKDSDCFLDPFILGRVSHDLEGSVFGFGDGVAVRIEVHLSLGGTTTLSLLQIEQHNVIRKRYEEN